MFTKKGDAAVLAKLGEAPAQYREIGERLHAIIRKVFGAVAGHAGVVKMVEDPRAVQVDAASLLGAR